MSETNEMLYRIAISIIPRIGPVTAKKVIAYVGSVEGVFRERKRNLQKIPGVGVLLAKKIAEHNVLKIAEKEIEFIERKKIDVCFYLDKEYPERLKHCNDGPLLLFSKGKVDWNAKKTIAVVGTRNATVYGRKFTDDIITEMAKRGHDPLIISGLAYGIDIVAHRAALENGLPTIAVLGHGLDRIYPAAHTKTAGEIISNGSLITEFTTAAPFERENFLRRNRIIAGLCDAVVVVESANKGGALVTADIAASYNRDVFAVPGKTTDKYSVGCNKLIKINKAALIEGISDLEYQLGWACKEEKNHFIQAEMFVNLNETEKNLLKIIKEEGKIGIDLISLKSALPVSQVSVYLLNLEFSGLIQSLPGKIFSACA